MRTESRKRASKKSHRPKRKPVQTTARDLTESLKSTHQGLRAFLRSFQRAGLAQAAGPYRQMTQVLVQQRLWSRSHQRHEHEPLWREIAETASAIRTILDPLVSIMNRLAELDKLEKMEASEPPATIETSRQIELAEARETSAWSAELALMFTEQLACSGTRLIEGLSWSDERRRERLRGLLASGVLERRGWGKGSRYQLSRAARERMALHLGEILAAGAAGR